MCNQSLQAVDSRASVTAPGQRARSLYNHLNKLWPYLVGQRQRATLAPAFGYRGQHNLDADSILSDLRKTPVPRSHSRLTDKRIFPLSQERTPVPPPSSASTTTTHCDSKIRHENRDPALDSDKESCNRRVHAANARREQNHVEADRQPENVGGSKDEARLETRLKFIGSGKSGAVYGMDSTRVLKVFHDEEAGEVERRVYQRLGPHPNITKLLEIKSDGSIILERGAPLRAICQSHSFNNIPMRTRVCWLRHAATGYQRLHSCSICHGDVGCGNLILTRDDVVKLIDFEGCSIDGGTAGSCYEWFSYMPSTPRVSQATDIFAFGCLMYEVSTGNPPNHQLEASKDKYREVEELYINQIFPSVAELPLGELMQRCWTDNFKSMEEIGRELDAFYSRLCV